MPCGGIEILGRSAYLKHAKTVHREGIECEICGRIMVRKVDMEYHMKIEHSDSTVWASS